MLYTTDLIKLVRCRFPLLDKHFEGVFPLNNLPYLRWNQSLSGGGRPLGLIVNTDTADLPGKHWVACLLFPNGRGECFDSFGEMPPPRVQFWMNKQCLRGWSYNKAVLQPPLSTLCGAYCVYYLYLRIVYGMKPDTIVSSLTATNNPDKVVLQFINNFRH